MPGPSYENSLRASRRSSSAPRITQTTWKDFHSASTSQNAKDANAASAKRDGDCCAIPPAAAAAMMVMLHDFLKTPIVVVSDRGLDGVIFLKRFKPLRMRGDDLCSFAHGGLSGQK